MMLASVAQIKDDVPSVHICKFLNSCKCSTLTPPPKKGPCWLAGMHTIGETECKVLKNEVSDLFY